MVTLAPCPVGSTWNADRIVTQGEAFDRFGNSELFEIVPTSKGFVRFDPWPVSPTTLAIVSDVYEMTRRMVPWATIGFIPHIYDRLAEGEPFSSFVEIDGVRWLSLDGNWNADHNCILLSLSAGSGGLFIAAAHEAWHALESRLSPERIAEIDGLMQPMSYGEGHHYLAKPAERRARLFEAWVYPLIEGVPGRETGNRLDEIFLSAWTGEMGAELDDEEFRPAPPAEPELFRPFAPSSLFSRLAAFWRPATC